MIAILKLFSIVALSACAVICFIYCWLNYKIRKDR
jgi:hypothetical protein